MEIRDCKDPASWLWAFWLFSLACFLFSPFCLFFFFFLLLPPSHVVISTDQLDVPSLYRGQYSSNKQTVLNGLRHVYRVGWKISKARSGGGLGTLSQAGFALFLGEKGGPLLQLVCAWFSNNGVLANPCFLYINESRSTRHRNEAMCQQLSVSEGSEPSFQRLCSNI